MSNPRFQTLGGGPKNMMGEFHKFMEQMQGKDPNQEIAKLLQSGRISPAQLNQAQQMAQQMQGMFSMFKK